MSFSSKVKAEICRADIGKKYCATAEAYGVLLYCNTFSATEIKIITGSPEFSARLPLLFKKAFGLGFDDCESGARKKTILRISSEQKLEKIFSAFGYDRKIVSHHINLAVLDEPACREAFIRGAFLAGGSVSNPENQYHIELATDHYSVGRETYTLLLEMGFTPKETSRNGNNIIYIKQSEAIADLLTTISAPLSAMDIMNAKALKDLKNSVNRRVNCDTGNASKIVDASAEQTEAIRKLMGSEFSEELSMALRETAYLRLENPEASISELAGMCNPPVSKSCMNHRLRKLVELSKTTEEVAR